MWAAAVMGVRMIWGLCVRLEFKGGGAGLVGAGVQAAPREGMRGLRAIEVPAMGTHRDLGDVVSSRFRL